MVESSQILGTITFTEFLMFIFVVIITFMAGGIVNSLIRHFLKEKASPRVYKPVSKVVMYTIYAAGLFFAFNNIIHFSLPAGLAALGVLGIAMLLPMVPILQGYTAGLVLAFERPFKEEDVIQYEGELCRVKEIGLRKTKLRSFSGKVITVPNILFATASPIINYSSGEFIKVTQNIDVAVGTNISKVRAIIKGICTESPHILPNVPQRSMTGIVKIFELPKSFLSSPQRLDTLHPRISIRSLSKDKISLLIVFWTWDITLQEQTVNEFYEKLIEKFKAEKIHLG